MLDFRNKCGKYCENWARMSGNGQSDKNVSTDYIHLGEWADETSRDSTEETRPCMGAIVSRLPRATVLLRKAVRQRHTDKMPHENKNKI